MAKFSGRGTVTARPKGPGATVDRTVTFEGGAGWTLDTQTELFALAVTNMGGENTYYEAGDDRDARFARLVHAAAQSDPEFVRRLVPWLRQTVGMRTASIAAAGAYAAAGAPGARKVVADACRRGDEPAEMLGWWLANQGRRIPKPVKRGIADAANRIYNERALIKYDTQSRGIRFGDVIELCHPTPQSQWQSHLFRHAIDRRHGRDSRFDLDEVGLGRLARTYEFDAIPEDFRRQVLRSRNGEMSFTGYTWERLAGWLPGGMDAEAWQWAIPQMGTLALIRNLRNFDQAGISPEFVQKVAAKISDPDEVRGAMLWPYQIFQAWRASGSVTYGVPLEAAMTAATANVPELPGRTIVLVDTSGSMNAAVSNRSAVKLAEIAAVFAASISARNHGRVSTHIYADGVAPVDLPRSPLRAAEEIIRRIGSVGHGTQTWPSLAQAYRQEDRVIVLTDCQDHPPAPGPIQFHSGFGGPTRHRTMISGSIELPANVPIYVWNLAGYPTVNLDLGAGRYMLAGFTDQAFKLVPMLEGYRQAGWDNLFTAAGV